jgi:hypothetical protein
MSAVGPDNSKTFIFFLLFRNYYKRHIMKVLMYAQQRDKLDLTVIDLNQIFTLRRKG